jgi:hypothetical protein
MTTPVHEWITPHMRSMDGRAAIEGIEIEILANIAVQKPDGTWDSFADISQRFALEWNGLQVPVFPLHHEADAYEAMGRLEKAALIRRTIAHMNSAAAPRGAHA